MAPDSAPEPIVGAEAAEQRVLAAPTYPQMRVILEREIVVRPRVYDTNHPAPPGP